MSHRLNINIGWEALGKGEPAERAAFGAVGIYSGDVCFTRAEDAFVNRVRSEVHLSGYQLAQWLTWNWWRLRWEPMRDSLHGTNLQCLWDDLREERTTPAAARERKLEALLGVDPDEADSTCVVQLLDDAQTLGESAVQELAAGAGPSTPPATANQIRSLAESQGIEGDPKHCVQLASEGQGLPSRQAPAWHRGEAAAGALRAQEQLGDGRISDERLCALAGISESALRGAWNRARFSFALDEAASRQRVVLRSASLLTRSRARRTDLRPMVTTRLAHQAASRRRLADIVRLDPGGGALGEHSVASRGRAAQRQADAFPACACRDGSRWVQQPPRTD